jgi:hypothetical protein
MTARSDSRNVDGRLSEAETSGDGVCLSGDVVVEDQSGRLAMIIEFVAIIIGVVGWCGDLRGCGALYLHTRWKVGHGVVGQNTYRQGIPVRDLI